jgi:hypothetical protein
MNKISILGTAAVAMMAVTACSSQDFSEFFGAKSDDGAITAVLVDETAGSRSNATDEGKFTWAKGDQILVFGAADGANPYTNDGTDGDVTATFKPASSMTVASENADLTYAIYPYNANDKYVVGDEGGTKSLIVNLPDKYEYEVVDGAIVTNTNAPMLGTLEGDAYQFRHLASVIRLQFAKLPKEAKGIKFTANTRITGDFETAIVDGEAPELKQDAEETVAADVEATSTDVKGGNSVIVYFDKALEDAVENARFIIPLPTGTYAGFTVSVISDTDGTVLNDYTYTTKSTNTFLRRSMGLYPTLSLNISVDGTIENSAIDGADLKALLEAGGDVVLNNDVEIYGQSICISKDIKASLDLNGHTLYGSNLYANRINVQDGEFTLKDSSSSQTGRFISTIARNSGLIYVGDPNSIYNSKVGGKVIVEGGTIDASITDGTTRSCGVVLGGAGEIEVNGGRIIASNFAVSGNGLNNDGYGDGTSYTAAKTTLKFSGGHLESTKDYALYLPQKAETTISGSAEIVGYTGAIAIQSGKLTIDGGTIIANGNGNAVVPELGDGTHGLYYAAVCEAAGYASTDVVINGGHFISKGTASDYNNLYKGEEAKYSQTLTIANSTETYESSSSWSNAALTFSDLSFLPFFKTGDRHYIILQNTLTNVNRVAFIDGEIYIDLKGFSIIAAESVISSLTSVDTLFGVRRGAKLTIDDTVGNGHISAPLACAIKLTEANDQNREGYSTKDAELHVINGIITGKSFAISGNGTRHGTKVTIDGGTFLSSNATGGTAFYHPQYGEATINGGTFKAYESGMEIRSGIITINGGSFISTAKQFKSGANGSGTTSVGVGLAVVQHSTEKTINVTIKGGTFKTAAVGNTDTTNDGYAFYNDKLNTDKDVTISVQGGNFEQAIYSIKTGFITGGNFAVSPDANYLADGYEASSTKTDGYFIVGQKSE